MIRRWTTSQSPLVLTVYVSSDHVRGWTDLVHLRRWSDDTYTVKTRGLYFGPWAPSWTVTIIFNLEVFLFTASGVFWKVVKVVADEMKKMWLNMLLTGWKISGESSTLLQIPFSHNLLIYSIKCVLCEECKFQPYLIHWIQKYGTYSVACKWTRYVNLDAHRLVYNICLC